MKYAILAGVVSFVAVSCWIFLEDSSRKSRRTPAEITHRDAIAQSEVRPEATRPESLPMPRELHEWPMTFSADQSAKRVALPKDWLQLLIHVDQAAMLANVPEIRYVRTEIGESYLKSNAQTPGQPNQVLSRIEQHPLMSGMPWRKGSECITDEKSAAALLENAREIRVAFSMARISPNSGADPEETVRKAWKDVSRMRSWRNDKLAPLLVQIVQPERIEYRLLLVEMLFHIGEREATRALARLAVFDPDQLVRKRAIDRLCQLPRTYGRDELLAGLRHLWTPAVANAAHALVALEDTDAVWDLVPMLNLTDPARPFTVNEDETPRVRELIRMNHNHNCVVCHAPAQFDRETRVVVRVPKPGSPIVEFPSIVYYNESPSDNLVRFDVTYLRQDFSATMPCTNQDQWPHSQRFDFLVRTRPATPMEICVGGDDRTIFSQREAVIHVLRTLTGKDGGDSASKWQQILLELPKRGPTE